MSKKELLSGEINESDRIELQRKKNRDHAKNSRLNKKRKQLNLENKNTLLIKEVLKLKKHIKKLENESIVHSHLFSKNELPNIDA